MPAIVAGALGFLLGALFGCVIMYIITMADCNCPDCARARRKG